MLMIVIMTPDVFAQYLQMRLSFGEYCACTHRNSPIDYGFCTYVYVNEILCRLTTINALTMTSSPLCASTQFSNVVRFVEWHSVGANIEYICIIVIYIYIYQPAHVLRLLVLYCCCCCCWYRRCCPSSRAVDFCHFNSFLCIPLPVIQSHAHKHNRAPIWTPTRRAECE